MYIIITGRLQVLAQSSDGQERVVNELGGGQSVGEMGLISGRVRSFRLQAMRDTKLVRLSKVGFERLIDQAPGLLRQFSSLWVERLGRNRHGYQPTSALKTIAVLPAGQDAPLTAFVEQLVDVLSDVGSVLLLNWQTIQRLWAEHGVSNEVEGCTNSELTIWLNQQESNYRFIVYQADLLPSAWSSSCLRQADRILLVAQASNSPELNKVEEMVYHDSPLVAQIELILLQQDKARLPRGTRLWLAQRSVLRHHHVHLSTRAHLERVVRFLTGRAVGLVLGGGGARGAAYIGVIRALLEAGIPLDIVGGTSAGALMATEYAMGCGYDEMKEMNKKFYQTNRLKRYTLPIISLIRPQILIALAKEMFGEVQLEDLWINSFAISCNISTCQVVVHRQGPLGKAIRATIAVPGIVPPVIEGRHLLVDGGLLESLPLDIMKELNDGPIITVNASPDQPLVLEKELNQSPSAWEMLSSWLNPFKKSLQMPTITTLMSRVVTVNQSYKIQQIEKTAEFYLKLPVEEFGMLDFTAIDQLAEMGYDYTRQQILRWKQNKELAQKLCP